MEYERYQEELKQKFKQLPELYKKIVEHIDEVDVVYQWNAMTTEERFEWLLDVLSCLAGEWSQESWSSLGEGERAIIRPAIKELIGRKQIRLAFFAEMERKASLQAGGNEK